MYLKISIAVAVLGTLLCVVFIYLKTQRLIAIGIKISEEAVAFQNEFESELNFLIVGDSSAVGVGAAGNKDSIAGRISADYPNASITNLAVNGSKAKDLIPVLGGLGEKQYNLIFVQIGGNDIVRRTDFTELAISIDSVLMMAKNNAEHVVLMTSGNVGTSQLLPFGTRWIFTKRTKYVREIFMGKAKKYSVPYVDLFRVGKADPFVLDPKKLYAEDMFHLSSEGYADWYSFVKVTLAEIDF